MSEEQSFVANVNNVLNMTISGDEKIRQLSEIVRQAEAETDELNARLNQTVSELGELQRAYSELERGSGVDILKKELEDFQRTARRSTEEFDAFLRTVQLDDYRGTNYAWFEELFEQIRRGSMTASEAIVRVKADMREMIELGGASGGGAFDAQMVRTFTTTLDGLSQTIDTLVQKFASIEEHGLSAFSGSASVGVDLSKALEQVDEAARRLDEGAKGSYQTITDLVKALNDYAGLDATKLLGVSQAFRNIADVGKARFSEKSVNSIAELARKLKSIGADGAGFRFDLTGLNNLSIRKASVDNLIRLVGDTQNLSTDTLKKLSKIDLSKFNDLSIKSSSFKNITDFLGALSSEQDAMQHLEGIYTAHAESVKAAAEAEGLKEKASNALSGALGEEQSSADAAGNAMKRHAEETKMSAAQTEQALLKIEILQNRIQKELNTAGRAGTGTSENAERLREQRQELDNLRSNVERGSVTNEAFARSMKNITLETSAASSALKLSNDAVKQDQKNTSEQAKLLKEYYDLLDQVVQKRKDLLAESSDVPSAATNDLDNMRAAIESTIDRLKSNDIGGARDQLASLKTQLVEIDRNSRSGGDGVRSFGNSVSALESQIVRAVTASNLLMQAFRQYKQMIKTAIDMDTAMTQLRIVTNNSSEEYAQYGKAITATAQAIGASAKDLVDSTTVYARLGYTLDESSTLAKYTTMLQSVGDIDPSSAQNAMTAIIKAYGKNADDIEEIMDKLVIVGNNFPISVAQIAEGMNNAGSALAAAGNSFDESVALLTAANTTVQNISKASTGLRTITARIRKTGVDLDDLGETIETAKYEEVVNNLTKHKVLLTEANGEYRTTYDILKDIAGVWNELTSMEQAAVAEQLSGNRQQNVFFSIIEQFQEAEKAMKTMSDSGGALWSSYEKYLDSTAAKLASFKAAYTALAQTVMDSATFNQLIEWGTSLVNTLDKVFSVLDKIGGILPVISAFVGGIVGKNLVQLLTPLWKQFQQFKTIFKQLTSSGGIKSIITDIGASFKEASSTIDNGAKTAAQSVGTMTAGMNASAVAAASLQIAFAAAAAAIAIFIVAIARHNQEQEAARNNAVRLGEAAKQESDEVMSLYENYLKLSEEVQTNAGVKDDLLSVEDQLIEALGIERSEVDKLGESYERTSEKIREAMIEKLKDARLDIFGEVEAQEYDLINAARKLFNGPYQKSYFGAQAGAYLDYEAMSVIAESGLSHAYQVNSKTDKNGNRYVVDLGINLNEGQNLKDPEEVIATFERLHEMILLLQDNHLTDSSVFKALNDGYQSLKGPVEAYKNSVTDLNETLVQQIALEQRQSMSLPKTKAEFVEYRQALVNAVNSDNSFIGLDSGTEDFLEIGEAVDNLLKKDASFLQFYGILSEKTEVASSATSELKKQLQELSEEYNSLVNGNMDYSKRPIVSSRVMQLAGWEDFEDGDRATTYSHGETIGTGSTMYTLSITPILEDGSVLTPESLREYIDSLDLSKGLEGVLASDTQNLIINIVPGDYNEAYWTDLEEKLQDVKDRHLELVDEINAMAPGTIPLIDTYKGSVQDLSEMLDGLKAEYELTEKAKEEMASGKGLSQETIKALKAEEKNYLDYLYEENGIIKLNTEAWTDRYNSASSKAYRSVGGIKAEIEVLERERETLEKNLDEWKDKEDTDKTAAEHIERLTELLGENGEKLDQQRSRLSLYISSLGSLSTELAKAESRLDAYNKAMSAGEKGDVVAGYASAYKKAIEDIEAGLTDSNAVRSAIELFFSDSQLAKMGYSVEKAAKELSKDLYKSIFKDDGNYGANFANYIRETYGDAVEGIYQVTYNDDGTFNIDIDSFERLSELLHIDKDLFFALVDALDLFGDGLMIDKEHLKELAETLHLISESGPIIDAGQIRDAVEELARSGKNAIEIRKTLDALKAGGYIDFDDETIGQDIQDVLGSIEEIEEHDNSKVTVEADTTRAETSLDRLQRKLDNLLGRHTLLLDANIKTGGVTRRTSGGAIMQTEADGTKDALGGPTLVNEIGPELIADNGVAYIAGGGNPAIVDLSPHAVVLNDKETKRVLRSDRRGILNGIAIRSKKDGDTYHTAGNIPIASSSAASTASGVAAKNEEVLSELDALISEYQKAISYTQNMLDRAIEDNDYISVQEYTSTIVAYYKQMMDAIQQEKEKYRAQGLSDTSDEIRDLEQKWWEYYDAIRDVSAKSFQALADKAADSLHEITNAYDTLKGAAQEYAENGFITIDTLEQICQMGIQYLAYLQDENGQLVLNEENIQRVIAARTEQYAVETALNYVEQLRSAIELQDAAALEALLYATEGATGATWDLVYAQLASLDLTDDQFSAAVSRVNALRSLTQTAISGIGRTTGTVKKSQKEAHEGLQKILQLTQDMIKWENEQQIQALEDQKDAYAEIIEKRKEMIRLAKEQEDHEASIADKVKQIAKLQAQIDQLMLDESREAQTKRRQLEEELYNLQKDLADEQAEYSIGIQEDALDQELEAHNEMIDKQIKALEEMLSSAEKLYQAAISRINSGWNSLYKDLLSWNYEYGNTIQTDLVDAWNEASAAVRRYGSFVSALANTEDSGDYSGATSLGSSIGSQVSQGTTEDAVKAIVSRMKKNSADWHSADSAKRKALEQENENLAKRLSSLLGKPITKTNGTWYIDGKELYKMYHTGGIAGDSPTLQQNEMLAVLKKGEAILDERREQGLYKLIDFTQVLSDKLGKLVSTPSFDRVFGSLSPSRPGDRTLPVPRQAEGMSFSPVINVNIAHSGSMDERDAEHYGQIAADTTLQRLKDAFSKRGITSIAGAALKA